MPKTKRSASKKAPMPKRSRSAEKIDHAPKKDKNWCDLPSEIKSLCIEAMDWETTISLSMTSKTEKSLADAKKLHFDRVTITDEGEEISVATRNHGALMFRKVSLDWRIFGSIEPSRARNLFKKCKFDTLKITAYDNAPQELHSSWNPLLQCAPFRFKNFVSSSIDLDAIGFFLENCETPIETITFSGPAVERLRLKDVVEMIPAVMKAKDFCIEKCGNFDSLWNLVDKWIETDAEVGKSIQALSRKTDAFSTFLTKFADRIIENTKNKLKIRTNNDSKHILLRKLGSGLRTEYTSCQLIPTDLPESEYDDGGEWIDKQMRYEIEGYRDVDSDDSYSSIESLSELDDYRGGWF